MPTEIRFRLNHLYQGPNAPFLHAADAGLFADNDIAVSFIEGFSSSQVARAIAAGEADAGFGDVSSTFELALRAGSVPVTCLLPVFARSPCCLGYLPQARPLALGDLGGATLCGPDGDTSARLLPLLLARNGLTDVRYNYLAVSPPERDRLVAGPWGIKEPAADCPLTQIDEIDFMLVPGVAFDRRGQRIGYGAGFYDRLLARRHRHTDCVAIAFDCQVVPRIPTEAHDQPIDRLITETLNEEFFT